MKHCNLFLAAWLLVPGAAFSQASPYRGLWVGEIRLDGVNEVSVPLDANNIPRAPNPAVTTRTFDAANLRLILHVNGAGQVSLLKQVAILNRKAGQAKSENDLALVTDERLYGNFPPQPAQRIASVVFDFGDAKATTAVDAVVDAAAAAAAASINAGASQAAAQTAAQSAAQGIINGADAAAQYALFLRDTMNSAAVTALSVSGQATAAQSLAAAQLKTGTAPASSFYRDTRGEEMIAALESAMAALPAAATAAERKATAQNVAAHYADTDNLHQRFLAGEIMGDAVSSAAAAAAKAAAAQSRQSITAVTGSPGAVPSVTTVNHQLATGNRISISGAPIGAYNGVQKVTRVDADHFTLQGIAFVGGKAVTNFAASSNLSPVAVSSPGHGLATGTRIVITGAASAAYNGAHFVTKISEDEFSIPVTFSGDTGSRGSWAGRSGSIGGYDSAPGGVSGVKVTAAGHGLNNGDRVVITGAGASVYNNTHTITRVDENAFTIPVAFGGNPAVKGVWSILNAIAGYSEPAVKSTTVTSNAHGLNTGDRITITGSGKDGYNGTFEIERLDADKFIIPVNFASADGNPSTKGAWEPAAGGTWKFFDPVLASTDSDAKVNDAKTEALRIRITAYDDTRGAVAIAQMVTAVAAAAVDAPGSAVAETQAVAETAGRQVLADLVVRSAIPRITPTADFTAFVRANDARFTDYRELAPIVAEAAAAGAYNEYQNVLHTADTVKNKAKERILAAVSGVYAAAARAQRTELPMNGSFGPGVTGLTGTIVLPANHPSNPFRHRRNPDHSTGFDITRVLNLNFDGLAGDSPASTGYGVDTITGTYAEEIHGLHKPLGPQKNTGLKVSGTFMLNRISLVDALNAR